MKFFISGSLILSALICVGSFARTAETNAPKSDDPFVGTFKEFRTKGLQESKHAREWRIFKSERGYTVVRPLQDGRGLHIHFDKISDTVIRSTPDMGTVQVFKLGILSFPDETGAPIVVLRPDMSSESFLLMKPDPHNTEETKRSSLNDLKNAGRFPFK